MAVKNKAPALYYTTGTVVFNNLITKDVFRGAEATGYDLTIKLSEGEEDNLVSNGVKVKSYKDTLQRKFSTQFSMADKIVFGGDDVLDGKDCVPFDLADLNYGARVTVMWTTGDEHVQHGFPTRLAKIRVFELGVPLTSQGEF